MIKQLANSMAIIFVSVLFSAAAFADGNPFSMDSGKKENPVLRLAGSPPGTPGHSKGRRGGGPPPWAPAHGYRNAHAHYRDYNLSSPPVNLEIGRCNREVMGQILGGAAGGAIGSQIGDGTGRLIAVAAGTLFGMIAGGEIGRSMDRADALCVDQALEHADTGETIRWEHGDERYAVTPRETFQSRNGRYCREYTMQTHIGNSREEIVGTACREEDGSWRIVN